MGTTKSKHQIEITAVDKASAVINGLDKRFKGLGSVIDRSLSVIGVGGVAALTGALVKSVKLASEEEQVMKRLQTAIEKTGKNYASVSGDVNNLLKSQQNLTEYADDQSAGALTTLVNLTGDLGKSMRALKVTEDLASTGLFDLESASTAVGKALTGNTMLLQRMGIKIKEGDDVLAELERRFGGSAARNVETFSGALKQLGNVVSDAFEALGGPLLKPLTEAAQKMRDSLASPELLSKIQKFGESIASQIPKAVEKLIDMSDWVINNGDSILTFFKALIGLRIATWAISAAASLGTLVTQLVALMPLLATPAGAILGIGAVGTAGGYALGSTLAGLTRRGRRQESLQDLNSNFVGPIPDAEAIRNYFGPTITSDQLSRNLVLLNSSASSAANGLARVASAYTNEERRVLGSRYFGAAGSRDIRTPYGETTWDMDTLGSMFPQARGVRESRSPYGDRIADRVLSQDFSNTPAGASIETLNERIQAIAPAFQYAMSAVTNTIVQGAITGALKIKDVFNALRNAILQILADIAARAATAGILSLLFPGIGFAGMFKGLGTGQFTSPGTSFRPSPIGANPGVGLSRFGGGGVTVNINAPIYGDQQAIRRQINDAVKQASRGQNNLSR